MIRASTGNAVMDMAAPRNRAGIEHEENESELGKDLQIGPDVRGKREVDQVARQQPQHAGAERNAGDDLANDDGLPYPSRQPGEDVSGREDQGQCAQQGS